MQQAGTSVWMDVSEIDGGSRWGQQITTAIEESQLFLLMLSSSSVNSEHVLREVSLAMEAQKPILPLLLEPVTLPPALRYPLAGLQHLELFGSDPETTRQALRRALVRLGVSMAAPDARETPGAGTPEPEPQEAQAPGSGGTVHTPFSAADGGSPPAGPPLHNLPRELTSFIGREEAIRQIKRLVSTTPLLTLTGPGGTGKTRLALQAARELLTEFPDGVFFVSLAPITDAGLVASTIAQTLGVREAPGQPVAESLKAYLRQKRLLLLLDNFEQLLDAAPLVTELLIAAPQLKVLVTSRAVLRLQAEREFPVPPLALPTAKPPPPPVEVLSQYEAVALFIQRAQAVKPDFTVSNENAPAVAEICHRLDGLPLAIELAAARVKLFAPQALLARLGSRFTLLTGGARDLPERQQTLRAAIAWSYDLLEEGEKTLFRRLSVFVGGFTFEAAEAMCNADGDLAIDLLDGVASLTDKSLLRPEPGTEDEPRFSMLETIREFGQQQLRENGEETALRERHALFFLALAEEAERHLYQSVGQVAWMERLEQEHDNLRAALGWSLAQRPPQAGLRLGRALCWFWDVRGYLREGREHLAGLLALPGAEARTVIRAKALQGAGILARNQGEYGTARVLLEESLAIFRELESQRDIAHSLGSLSVVVHHQGDYRTARALFGESLTIFRELEDKDGIAWMLCGLGRAVRSQGDPGVARASLDESLAIFRERGQKHGIAWSLDGLGRADRDQGDDGAARALLEESLRIFWELGDRRGMVTELEGLAAVAVGQMQYERAARLFGATERLREAIGALLPPAERAEREQSVFAIRAALNEEALAAAWAKGRGMSQEAAVRYALEAGGKE